MKDSKSVPVGSTVGRNEPPVPIGSQIQPSEPTGDKNRVTNTAIKRAGCAGLGTDKREVGRVWWAENRGVGDRSRKHAVEDEGAGLAELGWEQVAGVLGEIRTNLFPHTILERYR
jgi:hypothetical protein